MKICFYTTGDIKFIATMKRAIGMAKPLHKLGWDVSIIAVDTVENRKRIGLEAPVAQTFYIAHTNPFNEIRVKNKLVKTIKPDVVWVCSLGLRNFILYNRPKVFIEHSELGSSIPDNRGINKFKVLFFEHISLFYGGLICASVFLKQHFEAKAKKMNRKVLMYYSPYAFNEEVVKLPAILYEDLKTQYANKTVFIYMGTLTKNYGLFTMLEAVQLLKEQQSDFKLLLLGRGRHFEDAKQFVEDNQIERFVELLGYVDEEHLSSYFKIADAFISPLNDTVQDWARCPSKIYMYLPYKKPIITCEIGEPKQIFGNEGAYFDTNKPETLSTQMQLICNKSIIKSTVNIHEHSWETRAFDFNNWYIENFKK